jgi:hypothetical protein
MKKNDIDREMRKILGEAKVKKEKESLKTDINGDGNIVQTGDGKIIIDRRKTIINNPGKKKRSAGAAGIAVLALILALTISIQNDGIKKTSDLYTPAPHSASAKDPPVPEGDITTATIPAATDININSALHTESLNISKPNPSTYYLYKTWPGCARRPHTLRSIPEFTKSDEKTLL